MCKLPLKSTFGYRIHSASRSQPRPSKGGCADLVRLVALLLGTGRLRAQQLILVLYLVAHIPRALALPHASALALLERPVLAARSACCGA